MDFPTWRGPLIKIQEYSSDKDNTKPSIRSVSILHTDGTSISIVEIENKVVAPLFSHYQRVAEVIDVLDTVDCFAGSDSFVVVFEGEAMSFFGGLSTIVANI